jgi:uncharacterized membrane-anchored protein
MRKGLVVFGLVLVLAVANVAIVQKEGLLARGTPMLVELAPVDPRSLIQGDYMRLNYAMSRELSTLQGSRGSRDGQAVVTLDSNGVARFVRVYVKGTPLAPGERLLQYRDRGGRIRIGTDAFYFQEGHAGRYVSAKYGELRVDRDGGSVLVGLRDASLRALK